MTTKRRETQIAQIKRHLIRYGSITGLEALDNYGCFRLAAVIHKLRKLHWNIETDLNHGHEIKFAKYIYKAD